MSQMSRCKGRTKARKMSASAKKARKMELPSTAKDFFRRSITSDVNAFSPKGTEKTNSKAVTEIVNLFGRY